jgi:hypothetical protein
MNVRRSFFVTTGRISRLISFSPFFSAVDAPHSTIFREKKQTGPEKTVPKRAVEIKKMVPPKLP